MFKELEQINMRPKPFEFYTAEELWNNEHTSEQMLRYHLNEEIDISSRRCEFIDSSVNWMAERFELNQGTRIADFGCGPGLYTTRFAELGAEVTGIDFSKRSIAHAEERSEERRLNIQYVNSDYLSYEPENEFDLITMIMCDFCALSPCQRSTMLGRFNRLLKPGGSVLLDVYSLAAFEKREESASYELNQMNNFWSKERYYGFVNTFKYDSEKVILDKYTIISEKEVKTVYNWLQHFSKASIQKEVEQSGLQIKEFYESVAGGRYSDSNDEFAVVVGRE